MARNILQLALEDNEDGRLLQESRTEEEVLVDQEVAQEPVVVGDDTDLEELSELDETSEELAEETGQQTEAIAALESLAQYIENQGNHFDRHAVMMANIAFESIYQKAHISTEALTFSLEAYQADPKKELSHALEGIKEKVEQLFNNLKERLTKLATHIGEVLNSFNRNLTKLKRKVALIEDQLSKATLKEAKFPVIKPEGWCEYLCYLDTGFDKGLGQVGKDVEWLITEHRKMASASVNKYVAWFKQHSGETNNDFVFKKLKVLRNDFLLPGMTEFNRSYHFGTPTNNNMYYRSQELPGGRAFFTEVETTDKVGLAAVGMLENVDFGLGLYNPPSYKIQKAALATLVGASFYIWMLSVNPIIGAAGLGASLVYRNKQKIEGTGKTIKIDKKYLFETLSLNEAKQAIANVKSGIKALEQWNAEVLQKSWKNKDIDQAINKIIGLNRETVHNGVGARYMRAYCYALLNLMSNHSVGIHTYSFKVYNAMLNFTEKSLKQYS